MNFQLCPHCQTALEDFFSQNICRSCGSPQAVMTTENFFTAFGLPRRFSVDRDELTKRFYQLSRALHPDRFTASSPDVKARSLARMSFVNQAYEALKTVENTRAYLIQLEIGADQSKSKSSIPMEITEAWFELQELILEDPEKAKSVLEKFKAEIDAFNLELEKKMAALEQAYDSSPSAQVLENLSLDLQTQSYIKSIERDSERLKKNAYSN